MMGVWERIEKEEVDIFNQIRKNMRADNQFVRTSISG